MRTLKTNNIYSKTKEKKTHTKHIHAHNCSHKNGNNVFSFGVFFVDLADFFPLRLVFTVALLH